jgi:hypothetical protein
VFRSVVLPPSNRSGEVLVVEGVLRVRRLPGFLGPDGRLVPELVEVRVEGERVNGPSARFQPIAAGTFTASARSRSAYTSVNFA